MAIAEWQGIDAIKALEGVVWYWGQWRQGWYYFSSAIDHAFIVILFLDNLILARLAIINLFLFIINISFHLLAITAENR